MMERTGRRKQPSEWFDVVSANFPSTIRSGAMSGNDFAILLDDEATRRFIFFWATK
jgi:hypothetical protein